MGEKMKSYRNIVNIINFLRGYTNENNDLVEPIRKNIELLTKYNLKSTFLIQYDVFNSDEMMSLIKNSGDLFEKGCWFEIVEPLVLDAGLEWRGRSPWDFHANVAFPMGYTKSERYKLIDTYMSRFFAEFGYYPKCVGSWMIDSVSLDYFRSKYGVKAACICKEQYGTDGYNLWGGYYNHAYYPSKYNMICPAKTKENQIDLPVFRMLGTDPIHQYDSGLISSDGKIKPAKMQNVITIEPVYPEYGGNPTWVDWFLEENTKGNQLMYSYVQIGQENSFDWGRAGKGLEYQYPKIKEMSDKGEISLEYLSESGEWFSKSFEMTPPCAQPFINDFGEKESKSLWYYSKNYRVNIYSDSFGLRLRDFHKFDENYKERYYDGIEERIYSTYDNLPIVDGYRFSKEDFLAGGFFVDESGKKYKVTDISYKAEKGAKELLSNIKCDKNEFDILCEENRFSVTGKNKFSICLSGLYSNVKCEITDLSALKLKYMDFDYTVSLESGVFELSGGEIYIISGENNSITIML